MRCWKCGHEIVLSSGERIPFRGECEKCSLALHSCKNCRFYSVGKRNDCLLPGTLPVVDRQAANFCEEFAPSPDRPKLSKGSAMRDAARRLFGDDDVGPDKQKFDDLFH